MIESFLSTWPLFQEAYLVGWLIAVILSLIGVFMIAREQIFIGAAISQASTLGISFSIWLSGFLTLEWLSYDSTLYFMASLFSVLAAILTIPSLNQSHEALTGWIFLTSGSFAILMAAHNPRGLEEVQRLLSSSLIGANQTDLFLFIGLGLMTFIILFKFSQLLLFMTLEPQAAKAQGISVKKWNLFLSGWVGIVVGLAMKVTGLLYAFGCLILPVLIASQLSKSSKQLFYLTPLIALITSVVGFIIANYHDYPPAQITIALLCLEMFFAKGFAKFAGTKIYSSGL